VTKATNHFTWAACFACATFAIAASEAFAQGFGPSQVVVAPVTEKEVTVGQAFVGTVMPSRKAIIGSAVDGRVIEFPLNEGDRVAEGQPLAQLLTDTISLEIEAAEADLELRRQALAELENGTRPEEKDQAKARMSSTEARRTYMQARRERWQQLYETNRAISEEELDEAVSSCIESEQAYLEAKAAYDLAVAGPRKEQIAQARAQVAFQDATVNRLKDQRTKHTIISRFDGYVTRENTEVGQWVKQGDPVAEVAALDEVEVLAYVVEQHVPHIRVGSQVTVEVPAIHGQAFAGEVKEIVPQADVQARTFPVKIRVKNEIVDQVPLLKAGMYARVTLPTGGRQVALLVPKDAIVLGGPQPMVFTLQGAKAVGETGKVAPVPVKVGVADGGMIQVTGPLQVGQLVVVQGNERLRPDQEVAIQRVEAAAPDTVSQSQ
jgi:RND family efflux transporter MFP subunit